MSDLRPGYKQTDVGTIPNDWQSQRIGEVGDVLGGRQRSPGRLGEMTPYLRVANVFEGYIDHSDILEMPFTAAEKSRFLLQQGDILLNEGQSLELVGRSAVYRGQPAECCFQNTLVRFRAGPKAEVEFCQKVFERYLHQGVFASIALQTTSIAHLGAGRFANLTIPVPPLIEQQAIAGSLSDADELIAALEALIAKKRDIKQGAMRELVTGEKRLPGFKEEWVLTRLEALADIRSGGTPSTARSDFWGGDMPWCTPTDITALAGGKYLSTTTQTISELGLRNSSAEVIPAHSVIMTSRATIGECAINLVPVTTNQGFKNFVPLALSSAEYLYYALTSRKADFIALCSGSTFLEIGKKQLREFAMAMPPTIDEQRAIASVLSDMDGEITALENKLVKARALKRGMMQVWLPGEVRLV